MSEEDIPKLDLCFVCDTTGSMGGSICAVQQHLKKIAETITASEKRDLMLACVEYKDHCDPIVAGSKDFTHSVSEIKETIDKWTAIGGGDHPEAIAEGLYAALNLSWRFGATKILVLCADAPPHGVGSSGDSYPNGSPNGYDPLLIGRELAQKEVLMYTVGVNHPDTHTVTFLCTLSRMSGGRYLPLAQANNLPSILMGGAEEEVELAKFEKMMDEEEEIVLKEAKERGEVVGEEEVSMRVASNLKRKRVMVSQLKVAHSGGGEKWQQQEDFLSRQVNLEAYNLAQSKVDYSDIPTHPGGRGYPGGCKRKRRRGGGGGRGGRGGGRGGRGGERGGRGGEGGVEREEEQKIEQVEDYIQVEHVRKHMNRRKRR